MEYREVKFCPGLYKIFDEILVNAADNYQRDPKNMNEIKGFLILIILIIKSEY